jgi:hypothetical protein
VRTATYQERTVSRRPAAPAAAVRTPARRLDALATSGLAWGIVVSVGLSVWILFSVGGIDYYSTPLQVRGYAPAHRLLRPSGPAGQSFGLVGALMMLMPFFYMARKRIARLKHLGSARAWLEIHLFCGIVGPVLVTFHTSFKFNGIISAAYWSMVLVVLSGFVGRYLYVRIPRSLRGHELTRAELDAKAEALKEELSRSASSGRVLADVEAFERSVVPAGGVARSFLDLLFGEVALGRKLRSLDRTLVAGGVSPAQRAEITSLTAERVLLLRRTGYLLQTKKLFDLWHVFHLPLVYLLLVIAVGHIALALYMGYVPFRW